MMDGFLSRENERELFGLGEAVAPEPEKARYAEWPEAGEA